MTISNQKAFDSILSMAQNMLRLAAERAQSPVTPEMIEKELTKLSIMMLVARITVSEAGLAIDLRHDGLGAIAALMAQPRKEVA